MSSSFTILTPIAPSVERDRLAAVLTTASPRWLSGPTTFRGTVDDAGFRLTRNFTRMERTSQLLYLTGTTSAVAREPMSSFAPRKNVLAISLFR